MDKDELIDQIVKEGLSITTYGTPGQVQHQIAVNVAKAAVERLQPSGDGDGYAKAIEDALDEILAAQMVQPYRGWNITKLNKAADRARELRGLPSVRELNPDIAAMQDHAAENAAAIRALAGKDEA